MELRTLRYFVAVAEELHFGRAALRLHISQPPLSRAVRQLEAEVGAVLLDRSPAGVTLTAAGAVLLEEARALLERAALARERVAAAAGPGAITVGVLGGDGGEGGDGGAGLSRLAAAFRRRHPGVEVRVREADLGDPTCGLHAGRVDVALTRGPFQETGLSVRTLRTDAVGVLLRADDPLARRARLHLADLAQRRWFRFPPGTDPLWQSYWGGGVPREGPVVRAVVECRQAVLWNGTVGMTLLDHPSSPGLVVIPLTDMPPSPLVAAWSKNNADAVVRSFVRAATGLHRERGQGRERVRERGAVDAGPGGG
ncbi:MULTISPECIES: LysR substrate-binding domain-containing protein [Streptomyces]|uniref:LysR family transcriptional regulator n=4 Tax=Streptomyces TaxID=1883 RepID=A0A5P2B549_STRVZ|nr:MULTISPECIES: LysR substrate-binding domain-containing protein [Streptomyces]MYZ12467.1 LysR family transcriptional regulator [Streptomyces sp. SID337]QES25117.1 LysR family transcriptional regulator [Streptomyces venezuelae]